VAYTRDERVLENWQIKIKNKKTELQMQGKEKKTLKV